MSDDYAFNRWPSMAGTAKRCPRCATLESQLAEVTAEREAERDNHRQTITTAGSFRKSLNRAEADVMSLENRLEETNEQNGRLVIERDTLRTALRQCAEAIQVMPCNCYRQDEKCLACRTLDLPVVQAVLKAT